MRKIVIAAVALSPLLMAARCVTTQDFFGTDDPCQAIEAIHSGFAVAVATSPSLGKYASKERALYVAAREQCSDGDFSKVTLNKLIRAYAAAVTEMKGPTK
jgi:hypothetical protein